VTGAIATGSGQARLSVNWVTIGQIFRSPTTPVEEDVMTLASVSTPDDFRFSVSPVAPWGATRARGVDESSGAPRHEMQRPVPAPLKILDGARDRVRRGPDAIQFSRQRMEPRETGSLDEVA
jgi:hypothetical protein